MRPIAVPKAIPLAALPLAALAATAIAATTDLVVHCDPPLAGPLRAVAAAFKRASGVDIRIFPTAPNGIPAQIEREIQNDMVMTQPAVLDRLRAAGHLSDLPASAPWRNRLVIAAVRGGQRKPFDQAICAAPDPGWGGGPDGPALLAALPQKPGRVLGTFSTEEARDLLAAGEADYALIHRTELTSSLEIPPSPGQVGERLAIAAVTRSTRRPNPDAFLRFLATAEAMAILKEAGLETAT